MRGVLLLVSWKFGTCYMGIGVGLQLCMWSIGVSSYLSLSIYINLALLGVTATQSVGTAIHGVLAGKRASNSLSPTVYPMTMHQGRDGSHMLL